MKMLSTTYHLSYLRPFFPLFLEDMAQTPIPSRLQVLSFAITSILPILNHSLEDFDKCN